MLQMIAPKQESEQNALCQWIEKERKDKKPQAFSFIFLLNQRLDSMIKSY